MATTLSPVFEKNTYRKLTWRLVPFVFLCYTLADLDRVNVGFAKVQMQPDLGFSDTVFGLGSGIFFIGYFYFEVPSNVLLQKIGAKIWIARIMIMWGLLSACMIFTSGVHGLANWQWLYVLEGLPTVAVGIAVLLLLDDGPQKAKWLTDEEKALVVQRLEKEEQLKRSEGHSHHTFAGAFKVPSVWLFALVYFGIVMGTYGVSFWLPQIIKETITKDAWESGLISMIPWGVAAIAIVISGQHSDRTGERRGHVVGAAIIGAAALDRSWSAGFAMRRITRRWR